MESIPMPTAKTMKDLAAAAAVLNRKSDELNSAIEDFEDALGRANVGVSVWLDEMMNESERSHDPNGGPLERGLYTFEGWQLGYAKLDGKWVLAVRKVRFESATVDFEDSPLIEIEKASLLVNAPRAVRMEAAALFERLAKKLTMKLQQYANAVDEAKKVARGEEGIEISVSGYKIRWIESGSNWHGEITENDVTQGELEYVYESDTLSGSEDKFATGSAWRTAVKSKLRGAIDGRS